MAIGPLPSDDLVLEYNLLHLVDDGDSASGNMYTGTPTSSAAGAHVDDPLPNCALGPSRMSAAPSASCAAFASAPGSACCSSALSVVHTKEGETITPDEVAAFLLDGEQFLHDLDKVDTLDWTDVNQTHQMDIEPSDGVIDELETFTDLEMESSPCPSTCPSSMGGRWSVVDADELEGVGYQSMGMTEKSGTKGMGEEAAIELEHPVDGLSREGGRPSVSRPLLGRAMELMMGVPETVSHSGLSSGVSVTPSSCIPEEEEEEMGDEEMDEEDEMEDEINLLAKEVKYLDAQKDFLHSRAKSSRVRRKSVKQRSSCGNHRSTLAKSQENNQLLNELVAQQKVYQDNFKAMLAFAPVVDVRMALMTPIESYIRLGKDFNERRETILSLREEKLDMTYKFIEQKAAGIDINEPYQYSDMFEKFGKRYSVDFAISKYDGVTVFQVGRAIYEQIAGKNEALNSVMGSTTTRESFDTIKCNFMHQRIVSSMKWEGEDADKMPDMESNAIFYCRFGDNSAVLATDYIDQDDLHPYDTSNCIRKDVSSGVVLSGHTDADGNKFVVMKRYLMAKYHMYPHNVSQKQQDRYFASMPKCQDSMKTLIVDSLQRDGPCCPCYAKD